MSILGKVNGQNYFEGKTKPIMKVGLNECKRLEACGSSQFALIGSHRLPDCSQLSPRCY